jgi:cytochrome c oxidase cbb3-type subunit III
VRAVAAALALGFTALASGACGRELRELRSSPAFPESHTASLATDFQAGAGKPVMGLAIPAPIAGGKRFEENAHAVAEGKRWYRSFNCGGCHGGGGGGGMGPALMDDEWIYGSDSAQIFATILGGRPNGMPAYGGRVPAEQAWQLAAYVRSLAGLLRIDVAPGRGDSLQIAPAENSRDVVGPRPAVPEAVR